MKKHAITSIRAAIAELDYFNDMNPSLWQERMGHIFEYYQSQVKACMLLAFEKNLTSKVVYAAGINSLRYFEMQIICEDGVKTFYVGRDSHIGLPVLPQRFYSNYDGSGHKWSLWSVKLLTDALTDLHLYFDHLNDENLHKNGTTD
jgi:hypothetical protein